MKSINSFNSPNKNNNKKYKDLLQKKLKDRYKKKGFCFSNNNDSLSFNKTHKLTFPYQSSFDISKKIIKRNEFRKAMKDYVELKHTIKSYDEVNDKDKCKKLKKKNYSYEKINYTNLQEIFADFLRDKYKHNKEKLTIVKSKLKLDNINRNIRINRINNLLEKISVNSNKIKTKIDMGKDMDEYNENIYNKLVGVLNLSRKKLKKKINNSKRKVISLDIKKIDEIKKNKDKKYLINSNSYYDLENKTSIIENVSTNLNSEKQKYNNLYNNSYDTSNDKNKNIYSDNRVSKLDNNNELNIKIKERPLSHSRNIQKINFLYNISSNNTNNKRTFKSAFKKSPFKLKNKPLYTTKIDDIMKDFYRIKKMSNNTKMRYKETHLLTYKEIDKIIKVKEDLLFFLLKKKYNEHLFPKQNIKKKKNKRNLFIQKLKDNIDYIDKKKINDSI